MSHTIPPAAITSLALAIYALHDTLVENGVLPPGAAAQTLRRFDCPDLELMQHVHQIATLLDLRPFRVRPDGGLEVIEGGRA